MEYSYLLEDSGNKDLEFNDIVNNHNICILNILCYHVNIENKYPFLQFMMEKVPYCNNIVKEQLTFPSIIIRNSSDSLKNVVLERVKSGLDMLGCDFNRVMDDMYKGIIFGDEFGSYYALVNLTGIDINGLNFMRQTTTWIVLPSEIINTKKVFNIQVDNEVVNLFTDYPYIGLLKNPKTDTSYMLPDAVYTGSEIKKVEFCSIFGNCKTKPFNSCGEYYFFYRTFGDAVKDGGWLGDGQSNKIGERQLVENNSNKFIMGGINRYALFIEGKIYLESSNEFSLTDDIIENFYPEPCIIICYTEHRQIKPDILVKNYESFVCLSYHKLNKSLLGDNYEESNKRLYMIA